MSHFIVLFTDFSDSEVFFNFYGDSKKNRIEDRLYDVIFNVLPVSNMYLTEQSYSEMTRISYSVTISNESQKS